MAKLVVKRKYAKYYKPFGENQVTLANELKDFINKEEISEPIVEREDPRPIQTISPQPQSIVQEPQTANTQIKVYNLALIFRLNQLKEKFQLFQVAQDLVALSWSINRKFISIIN